MKKQNDDASLYEYRFEDLAFTSVPLPEDIAREKAIGHYDLVREKIRIQLLNDKVSETMKKRLRIELDILRHLEQRYTVSDEQAVDMMHRRGVKDFTMEELEQLRLNGTVDYRYINEKVCYLDSFASTLLKVYPEYKERVETTKEDASDNMISFFKNIRDGQPMQAHIHIRHNLHMASEGIDENETLIVHMPVPKENINDQMRNIRILHTSHEPFSVAAGDTLQPTICFKEPAKNGMTFHVEYELDHVVTYHDLTMKKYEQMAVWDIPEHICIYTQERHPHIAFTPYLRFLADEIRGNETNPLKIARACYDYVTTKVVYRFAPDYASITNVAQYCAVNGKGDCGIQALLLITLLRILGIPARWQSGLAAEPGDIGEHDWVKFYIAGIGWLLADPSYGGAAYRRKAYDRWNFYFGNMDPFRLPMNEEVMEEWEPVKQFARCDPCDSQSGEAEYEHAPCPEHLYSRTFEDLGIYLG